MNEQNELDLLFRGRKELLLKEAYVYSELANNHSGEKGRSNEALLIKTLRDFLPEKMGISTGFIWSVDKEGELHKSSQQDIIIYDAFNNVPLYRGDSWGIYPIEMVYATIEVKTEYKKIGLEKTLKGNVILREMARKHKYYLTRLVRKTVTYDSRPSGLPPRCFVFCYRSSQRSFRVFLENVIKAHEKYNDAHLHGICVLDKDWFIARKTHDNGKIRENMLKREKEGWKHFIQQLHLSCEGMIPEGTMCLGTLDRTRYLPFLKNIVDKDKG